jgi:hypothetical protein
MHSKMQEILSTIKSINTDAKPTKNSPTDSDLLLWLLLVLSDACLLLCLCCVFNFYENAALVAFPLSHLRRVVLFLV